MKRYLIALAVFVSFVCSGTALAAEKVYINGIDANYPPHAFIGKSGTPEGFDVDALNWVAAKMGFKVKHVAMDWDTIVGSLVAKKIDMVCSGMSISPERKAVVTFTEPYFRVKKMLVVRNDKKFTREELLSGNKVIGVQRGTNEDVWLEENKGPNKWNYTLKKYGNAPMAIEDLVNGRIDAVACDSAPANDAIKKGHKPVSVAGEFAEPDEFGVATRNEDQALRDLLNKGFQLLRQDPYWEELQKKYDTYQ